jgi:hypothetical protein
MSEPTQAASVASVEEWRYPRCDWTLTDIYDVQWVCTLPQHDPLSLHDPVPVEQPKASTDV